MEVSIENHKNYNDTKDGFRNLKLKIMMVEGTQSISNNNGKNTKPKTLSNQRVFFNTFCYNALMLKGIDFIGISVVYACHDGKGNFLLSKRGKNCRDEHGTWDPGGGGIEFGDTAEETLRKEIMEEYSTPILNYEFMGYRDVFREQNGKKTHWIALDFKVLVDKEKVKNGEPHKFDEIGWFKLDNLPTPLHSQYPHFLKKYMDKLVNKELI